MHGRKLGIAVLVLVGLMTASFVLTSTKNVQASSVSVTLFPTDDAVINQHDPNMISGYGNKISTRNAFGGGGSYNWGLESLLKFNLSSIPKNSTITSATLRLWYSNYADTNPQGRKLNLYAIISDWNESTVTWNTHPSYAFQLSDYATVPWSTGVWMEWNVTIDIQSFIDGNLSLYGWKIADEKYWGSSNIPITCFSSKEGSHAPYLEVKYYTSVRPHFNWIDHCHQATDDAMINKRYPLSNYGFEDWIRIRNAFGGDGSSNWAYEGLVKFDLSAIPKNSTITSATLRLWYGGVY